MAASSASAPATNGRPPRRPVLLDWTRDPPPPNITPFQQFTRDVDWTKSPVGPMADWPDQLRQMVLLVMQDPSPAVVYWGELPVIVYNEPYTALIGDKHPSLQGSDASIGFAEVWDHFAKLLEEGRRTGLAKVEGNSFLLLNRYGYLEETHFSWKFVPIIGPEGYVVGSHATVVEVTREILADRRLLTARELGTAVADCEEIDDLWKRILQGLEFNDKDLPLIMLYEYAEEATLAGQAKATCILQGTVGLTPDHKLAPKRLDLSSDNHFMASIFRRACKADQPVKLDLGETGIPEHLLTTIDWRGFEAASTEFITFPIKSSSGQPSGILFAGLNPRKRFDDDFSTFINVLAQQIQTPHVSAILLQDQLRRGLQAAKQAALDRDKLSKQLLQRTEEFQQSELKFTRFADRAGVGLALLDPNGQIVYANSMWVKLTSLSSLDEPVAWTSTVLDEDLGTAGTMWQRLIVEKEGVKFQVRFKSDQTVKDDSESPDPARRYSSPDEHSSRFQSTSTTVICSAYPDLNSEGHVKTVMACITDITELQQVEAKLRKRTKEVEQSEGKWRRFANQAPIGVVIMTPDGDVEFANNAWYETTGLSRDQVGQMDWLEAMHPDDVEKSVGMFKACLAGASGSSVYRLKKRWTPPPGQEINDSLADWPTWILGNAYADIAPDGKVRNLVGWLTDISSQKLAEDVLRGQMEQAVELKRQQEYFIDMTSHEMRNPLSAILHSTDEILAAAGDAMSDLDKPGKLALKHLKDVIEATETIAYCAQHQKRIVDDILTLSKLDSNLLVVSPVPTKPLSVIQSAMRIFEGEIKAAGIGFTFIENLSQSEMNGQSLLMDPSRLLQVFINLMTNAIKFTRSEKTRQITVKLSVAHTRPRSDPEDIVFYPSGKVPPSQTVPSEAADLRPVYLCVSVQDTGRGLSPDETMRIFNRFAQATPKTHVSYGGSGLGLFVSRQLTEMHGGEIGVSSAPQKGSTFAFYVETYRARDSADADEPAIYSKTAAASIGALMEDARQEIQSETVTTPPAVERLTLSYPNGDSPANTVLSILIVEDNLVNQKVLTKLLRRKGCIALTANHGEEALAVLQQSSYCSESPDAFPLSVVLMDLEMPVMDGLTCVRRIRELEQSGVVKRRVPVVALTANARDKHIKEALEAGMDDVAVKPCRIDRLFQQIHQAIDKTSA